MAIETFPARNIAYAVQADAASQTLSNAKVVFH